MSSDIRIFEVRKKDAGKTVYAYITEQSLGYDAMAFSCNNVIVPHIHVLKEGDLVAGYPMTHREGYWVYLKSLYFLLSYATRTLYPRSKLEISHTVARNVYCYFRGKERLTEEKVFIIRDKMRELVNSDIELKVEMTPREDAIALFRTFSDCKEKWEYGDRFDDMLPIYTLNDTKDYFYGPFVPTTGLLKTFDLAYYMPGFLLRLPNRVTGEELFPFKELPKFFDIVEETGRISGILDVSYTSSLNRQIEAGNGKEIVLLGEALQEKRIAEIAKHITENSHKYHLVIVAGPSSSGKTTFTNKLSIALRVNGKKPIVLSMDDYYVNREQTPLGPDGEPDFEAVDAIDIPLFQKDLESLISGVTIPVPSFNFKTGQREYRGQLLTKEPDSPIIIEGIHGLNPRLTNRVPSHLKYMVYVTTLTQLNMDPYNHIRVSEARLIRRLVRDNRDRNLSPEETLALWPKVRKGEEEQVFQFQELANVHFNSHLFYELSVLKGYAEPILKAIKKDSPAYMEAERLLDILKYFDKLEDEWVPPFSLLREFIGTKKGD